MTRYRRNVFTDVHLTRLEVPLDGRFVRLTVAEMGWRRGPQASGGADR
ncbi:hypothetical protein NLX86_13305 [Streptomyces sp. A3M-1-3]|nr:hypothetical protein [Streptomyces sp. A3M-1-3]MCP3819055.1 hypothetical protein [Streptomyces sp. A3M-1-3]